MATVSAAVLLPLEPGYERRSDDLLRFVGGSVGFGAAALIAHAELSAWEQWLFIHVNQLPDALSPALVAVMQAGSFPAVFVAAGLALLVRRYRLAAVLASGGTAVWLLAKAGKAFVERGRPTDLIADVIVRGGAQSGLGFPSGHAAVAAFVVTAASPYLTRPARNAGWVVVGTVVLARVYVGAHFPLDGLGGVALGWAAGSLANWAFGVPPVRARQRVRRPRSH